MKKETKASENLVSLQIFASRQCVDLHACIGMHPDLYVHGSISWESLMQV